jgi:hypothetical protein
MRINGQSAKAKSYALLKVLGDMISIINKEGWHSMNASAMITMDHRVGG